MAHQHAKVAVNIKKAMSSLERIRQMLERGEYCVDVMQQNLAVMGLLKSAHQMLMEDHLHSCFRQAMDQDSQDLKAKMVEEILKVTKLSNK